MGYTTLAIQRAYAVATFGSKRMTNLDAFSTAACAHLKANSTLHLNLADRAAASPVTVPERVRSVLLSKGVKELEFSLQTNHANVFTASTIDAITGSIRHLALDGLTATEIEASWPKAIDYYPTGSDSFASSSVPLTNFLGSSSIKLTVNPISSDGGIVKIELVEHYMPPPSIAEPTPASTKEEIAKGILGRASSLSIFSKAYWREGLADIVMSDKKLIPKFSAMVTKLVVADRFGFLSRKAKGEILMAELKTQFSREEMKKAFPWYMRAGLWLVDHKFIPFRKAIFYSAFKFCVTQSAKLFIGGENFEASLKTIQALWEKKAGYILDFVAEEATTTAEVRTNAYKYLLHTNSLPKGPNAPERILSIKLSSLVANFDAAKKAEALKVLHDIVPFAKEKGMLIVIDMEQFARKDVTLDIFETFHRETSFQYADNLGIVCQTYLKSSLEDTARLARLAQECSRVTNGEKKLFVRFVKGAYPEHDKQFVLDGHEAVNLRYIECLRIAYESFSCFRIAIASHNLRTISEARALAREMDLDEKELEFEMLLGMPASPLLYALKEEGFITRFYVPTGRFEESIKYFMRRLEENASSSSCQKHYKDYQRGKISEDEYLKLVFSPVEPNPPVAVVGV